MNNSRWMFCKRLPLAIIPLNVSAFLPLNCTIVFAKKKEMDEKKTTHFDTSAVLDSVLSILSVLLLMFFIDTKI